MKLNRNIITPLITIVYLVVALTGLLMLFHVFDGYTEVLHEILGLLFVFLTVFHIVLNWKSLKIHFKKRFFIPSTFIIVAISILLITYQHYNPKLDTILLERMVKAPIVDVLKVLQIDSIETFKRLEANGILINGAVSIEEISNINNIHHRKVFDLILE